MQYPNSHKSPLHIHQKHKLLLGVSSRLVSVGCRMQEYNHVHLQVRYIFHHSNNLFRNSSAGVQRNMKHAQQTQLSPQNIEDRLSVEHVHLLTQHILQSSTNMPHSTITKHRLSMEHSWPRQAWVYLKLLSTHNACWCSAFVSSPWSVFTSNSPIHLTFQSQAQTLHGACLPIH